MLLKEIPFEWNDDGENCGQPVLRLEMDIYKATVYFAWDTKMWSARADKLGAWRRIHTQAEAIKKVEDAIRSDITYRITEACKTLRTYIDWDEKKCPNTP